LSEEKGEFELASEFTNMFQKGVKAVWAKWRTKIEAISKFPGNASTEKTPVEEKNGGISCICKSREG
jgi:hypothetical protein